MINKFFNTGIKKRLLLSFTLVILISITIITSIGSINYKKTIQKELEVYTDLTLTHLSETVDTKINIVEKYIDQLCSEVELKSFFNDEYLTDAEFGILDNHISNNLNTFSYNYKYVNGILLVNNDNHYISNTMYKSSKEPFAENNWYIETINNKEKLYFFKKDSTSSFKSIFQNSSDDTILFSKAYVDEKTNKIQGVVLVDINLDVLRKELSHIQLGERGDIYIMDSNKEIIFTPINDIVYRVKEDNLIGSSGRIYNNINNKKYEIVYKQSHYTGWIVVGIFPYAERFAIINKIILFSILVGIITLIITLIISVLLTKSIVKPIDKLSKLMKEVEKGNLNVTFESNYSDEISELGKGFNNMVSETKNLLEIVQAEEKEKRKAEIKILQEQIKPHFLYNTLDTIQWLAQDYEAEDIVEIVSSLTSLLRIGLSKGAEVIYVKDEIEHVKSYITIQKIRYEGKVDFQLSIDEEILNYKVLKLILQPIIENAIYHGVKEKRGKGLIVIKGEKIHDKLHFTVSDNGKGMSKKRLNEVISVLEKNHFENNLVGFGTYNVNERIRLTFGDDYGLFYESNENVGTVVHIWYPAII